MKYLYLVTGIASLLAIADLPYGYYEFLRWLVTIAGTALAIQASSNDAKAWLLLAIPAIVLWNPFFGATMDKSSWLLFNLSAGIAFIAAYRSKDLSDNSSSEENTR
jgi:hypothetical protein